TQIFRKLLYGSVNGIFDFIPEKCTFRRFDILEGVIAVIELCILGTYITVRRASPTRHQMILRRIDGDAVQPRIERTVPAKISQRTIGLDKCFLSDILSFVRIMHEAYDQPQNLVLILEYQQIKSPFIPTLYSLDQLLVLLLG